MECAVRRGQRAARYGRRLEPDLGSRRRTRRLTRRHTDQQNRQFDRQRRDGKFPAAGKAQIHNSFYPIRDSDLLHRDKC